MNVNRTMIFAALLAAGIATGASRRRLTGTTTTKPRAPRAAGAPGHDACAAQRRVDRNGQGRRNRRAASALRHGRQGRRIALLRAAIAASSKRRCKAAWPKSRSASWRWTRRRTRKVKAFAKRLVDDHTKANAELTKIASAKGITPPPPSTPATSARWIGWRRSPGPTSIATTWTTWSTIIRRTVRDFRSISKSAKDADIKAFAASTLPTLEQHLQKRRRSSPSQDTSATARRTSCATAAATGRPRRPARARPARRNRQRRRARTPRRRPAPRVRARDADEFHAGHRHRPNRRAAPATRRHQAAEVTLRRQKCKRPARRGVSFPDCASAQEQHRHLRRAREPSSPPSRARGWKGRCAVRGHRDHVVAVDLRVLRDLLRGIADQRHRLGRRRPSRRALDRQAAAPSAIPRRSISAPSRGRPTPRRQHRESADARSRALSSARRLEPVKTRDQKIERSERAIRAVDGKQDLHRFHREWTCCRV